jgi:endonuclease YncB( thermonuclease family)
MAIQAKPASTWKLVLLILIAAIVWGLDAWKKAHPGTSSAARPTASPSAEKKHPDNPPRPTSKSAAAPHDGMIGDYEVYRNCQLDSERHNDGDSFQIKLPDGRREVFRLYFVDTPESEFKEYRGGESNHERIAQQAKYFGITPDQAVEIGQRGKHFTLDRLAKKPFTLYTRWDSPFNDQRYHAFIEIEENGHTASLDALLVEQGFCRIFTKGAVTPDGTSMAKRNDQLHAMERQARDRRSGAWGLR